MIQVVPSHIAVVMDGNGRWAEARGLARAFGHRKGAEATRALIESVLQRNIPYLTLFCFSSENWNRPAAEVEALLNLLRRSLRSEVPELFRKQVRIRTIGNREALPADLQEMLGAVEEQTRDNDALVLTLAINYGGRQDLVRAAAALASEAVVRGTAGGVDEAALEAALETSGIPDPDLLIRTGRERRISNFMLWQLAYTELVFSDTLWPDFGEGDLEDALREFQQRERRFGGHRAARGGSRP